MPMEVSQRPGLASPPGRLSPTFSVPLRILNKGPEYFRPRRRSCQDGAVSVRERLEADRLKYVKSPEVVRSSSVKLADAADAASGDGADDAGAPRGRICCGASDLDLAVLSSAIGNLQQIRREELCRAGARRPPPQQQHADPRLALRRRSDGFGGAERDGAITRSNAAAFIWRLLQGVGGGGRQRSARSSSGIKEDAGAEAKENAGDATDGAAAAAMPPPPPRPAAAPEPSRRPATRDEPRRARRPPSPVSRAAPPAGKSVPDSFFDGCGLDREIIASLRGVAAAGAAGAGSVRSSDPDLEGLSERRCGARDGGDSGAHEDDPAPVPVSVIERNARIIKWLYGCRRASCY